MKVLDQSLMGLGVVRSGVPEQAVNPARRRPLSQDGRLQIDRQRGSKPGLWRRGPDAAEIYWNQDTLGIIAVGAKNPRAQPMELTPCPARRLNGPGGVTG